ncbi:MAG: hypothetical protein U0354_17050 [Candidatus Sericytochromatia bacterium]
MKKIICSTLLLLITSCQNTQTINISPNNEIKQNTKISSKTGIIKADNTGLFPSTVGYTWNYDVVFHPTDDPYVDYPGTYTLEVDKSRKTNNQTTINLKGIDSLNNEYNFPVLNIGKDKVDLKGITYLGFGGLPADGHNIEFLHLPFKEGEKWDDKLWTGQTMKKEKVTIPSGTFEAWKISVIGTYQQAYTAVGNYWITPGIGIIKSELSVPNWTLETVLTSAAVKSKK